MSYIFGATATIWNERLAKCLKDNGYTQETFAKAYRSKYETGTQTDVSRWMRVGNTITSKKTGKKTTIGFPSYDSMKKIADFFDVSVGYLTGETDYLTFELEKACMFFRIDQETALALKGITTLERFSWFDRRKGKQLAAALKFLLASESFPLIIEGIRECGEVKYREQHLNHFNEAVKQLDPSIRDLALQCLDYSGGHDEKYGDYDDFADNGVEPTEELLDSIKSLQDAQYDDYIESEELEPIRKVAEYELYSLFFQMRDEVLCDDHLSTLVFSESADAEPE